jgi:methylmalonyl-CoA mutase
MSDERLALAAGFPEVSVEAWKKSLDKVLGGAPFEKKMVVKTYDGIDIQPLYTKADWSAENNPSGFPGAAPFIRGNSASGRSIDGWDIRAIHAKADISAANDEILDDLERGVTSLTLQLDEAALAGLDSDDAAATDLAGRNGIMVSSLEDLDDLLDGVLLDLASVSLEAGAQAIPAAALLAALWESREVSSEGAMGAFNADPLGTLAALGSLPKSLNDALLDMANLAKATSETYPNVTAVKVDTSAYYGAGATETQDLAIALATGTSYLRSMTEAGLSVDDAAKQIVFCFANGADIFTGIAKLRAARLLWSQVVKACGGSDEAGAMNLHATTAARALSKRDPWVNILRTTATCFAGSIGGADSITVLPFDYHCGLPDGFSRRIARNQQVVLQEESYLNKVIDPAGGSWFIENLTEQYANKAWTIFQDIEAQGGMGAVLQSGWIQEKIATTWQARLKNIATRKDALTGISEFPNILEEAALIAKAKSRLTKSRNTEVGATDLASLTDAALKGATIGVLASNLKGTAVSVKALPAHRLAEGFEKLRDAADVYKAAKGHLPKIFSANIGAIAKHTARASFAKNFFEAGGVQATQNNGFATAEEVASAFKETGAEVAVICGSDGQYDEQAAQFAASLKAAGANKIYLAGRGEFAGVDQSISMGSNVLDTLQDLHTVLGV